MRTFRVCFIFLLTISLVVAGCGTSDRGTSTNSAPSSGQQQTTATSSVKSESDTLPLLPIMINLEQNMNAIQAGMWREDYGRIQKAAEGIGHHAKIPKSQVKKIKSILGPEEFKTFVADDKKVHRTSLELADAAKNKDFQAVTERYVDLYDGCVSCHLSHRQKIRESPKW